MEFKLNRIDTDIRKKINDDRSTDKVHNGKGINVNKDLNDDNLKKQQEKKSNKQEKKRIIIVDGIKSNNKKIKIEAEKDENIDVQNSKGRILDIKK